MLKRRHATSHAATPRAGAWLPLWLTLAVLGIGGIGALGWWMRHGVLARYHYFRLADAMVAGDTGGAFGHLQTLLRLPPGTSLPLLRRTHRWPEGHRRWLADQIAGQEYDEHGLRPLPDEFAVWGYGLFEFLGVREEMPFLDLALVIDPTSRDALRRRGRLAMLVSDFVAAAYHLEAMLTQARAEGSDGDWNDYRLLGIVYLQLNRFAQAEEAFRYAIRMMPRESELYQQLVITLERQGRYNDAIRVLCEYMVARPVEMPDLLFWRGRLFALQGVPELGWKDIQAARMRGASESWDLLRMKWAQTLLEIGRIEEALALFDEVFAETDDPRELRRRRASALLGHTNLYAQVVEDYEHLILAFPGAPEIYNNLAWLYATATDPAFRDPPRALAFARRAYALDQGESPFILDTLAEAYFVNGAYERALALEMRAGDRGGEMYARVIDRYRKAVDAAARGETPAHTPHPLLDLHHIPPPADPTPLDLRYLPTPPRVGEFGYERAMAYGFDQDMDTRARYMANAWLAMPVSAVDDPRVDLLLIARTLRRTIPHLRIIRPDDPEVLFLTGLLHGLDPREMALDYPGTHSLYQFGRKTGRVLRGLSREETAQVLHRLTTGVFAFSECLPQRSVDTTRLAPEERDGLSREWIRVEARILHVARGEAVAPAPDRDRKRRHLKTDDTGSRHGHGHPPPPRIHRPGGGSSSPRPDSPGQNP